MLMDKKIYIAGRTGMVGSAILRKYRSEGFANIITADYPGLDLTRRNEVEAFFEKINLNWELKQLLKLVVF